MDRKRRKKRVLVRLNADVWRTAAQSLAASVWSVDLRLYRQNLRFPSLTLWSLNHCHFSLLLLADATAQRRIDVECERLCFDGHPLTLREPWAV